MAHKPETPVQKSQACHEPQKRHERREQKEPPESTQSVDPARQIQRQAVVEISHAGQRLDQVAAQLFPEFSRARLQQWIQGGALRVDGHSVKQRDKVSAGAVLTLRAQLEAEVAWSPESMPLEIVYEDDELLVINKPPGVVVHPGAGNQQGTLVNALLHHRSSLETVPRAGIVHRIDKETSGLLVVAATLRAHHTLVEQLQKKTVSREYFAIARGTPTGGGRVDAPIGRHPRQRTKMAVVTVGGKPAVTHYRLAERFRNYTALNVALETGRTHQIRVHMAHRGYPLLGDPVYGGRLQIPAGSSETLAVTLRRFRRQALHARALSFEHPGSGESLQFEAPLPDDLRELLSVLREHNALSQASNA